MVDASIQERLRDLPAVDQLAARLVAELDTGVTGAEATALARTVIAARRRELLGGNGETPDVDTDVPDLVDRARQYLRAGPRRALNGTGVIIHTNLGRAPLSDSAAAAVAATAGGYLDLEFDLRSGRRGSRDSALADVLCELTGADDATVVNNGAAATLLAAAALAGPGRSIVVSRGQLVEIGGGFRVPDVVAQAGARLIEVGTTNRTRLGDYERAVAGGADVIMRVHPSNFRTLGFVEDVGIEALCTLGVPVIDDLGSGVLGGSAAGDGRAAGPDAAGARTGGAVTAAALTADEPAVRDSVAAGAAVVCFSGDKLLGGPQAGILVGTREAIARCRRHPLARALRLGRLPLTALIATLKLYRDPERAVREIPVLAMLTADPARLAERARWLAEQTGGEMIEGVSRVGGGTLPLLELRGPVVALSPGPDESAEDRAPSRPATADADVPPAHSSADALAARLRAQDPPLITRIAGGRVIIDPRTLLGDAELHEAAAAVRTALT